MISTYFISIYGIVWAKTNVPIFHLEQNRTKLVPSGIVGVFFIPNVFSAGNKEQNESCNKRMKIGFALSGNYQWK